MPEGHTIHRLARDQAGFVGHVVHASSPQGRFADGAATVDGARTVSVEAHGKHLVHRYDDGHALHVHLGMAGSFFKLRDPSAEPRPQVRLRLGTDAETWDLVAPSRCEVLDAAGLDALLSRLGPDPLDPDGDPDAAGAEVYRRLARKKGSIGAALLDQAIVAGVGNVFRAEALAACGVHPNRPADAVDDAEWTCLWSTLRSMMQRGVEEGRIITVDAPPGSDLPEAESRYVYKQSDCRRCGTPIVSWDLNGRTAYACPHCQPE